jgi:asparagine synthetase B (glutamine-hydrolysing)
MIDLIESGVLPKEREWSDYIDFLREKVVSSDIKILDSVFSDAIKKRVNKEKVGVLFSGGVDSVVIAFLLKKFGFDFVCFSVGLKDCPDLLFSKIVAERLNFNFVSKEFSEKEALELFKKTAKLYKNPSTLDIGVGSVIFAGVELGIKRDIKVFFTGLGSEEIFAGYQRHELSKDIQEECWKGLKTMFKRDFLRDFSIAEYFNISLRLPFLDEAVILSAMGIPEKDKIKGDMKKIPIRKVAIKEGLPEEFALRKKKAAQYGSGFDKLLRKLARNAKIDKLDFIKSLKE